MDKAANIHRIAEDMVRQHGKDADFYLHEKAQIAALFGDKDSAITNPQRAERQISAGECPSGSWF
jgi:hypothetical protein